MIGGCSSSVLLLIDTNDDIDFSAHAVSRLNINDLTVKTAIGINSVHEPEGNAGLFSGRTVVVDGNHLQSPATLCENQAGLSRNDARGRFEAD